MAEELTAGYAHRRKGVSSYMGALKENRKAVPVWTCKHDHLTPGQARLCADLELDRRKQGEGEVFVLVHCKGCRKWWEDGGQVLACPRCEVPLERLKLAVVERGPS